MTVYKKGAKWWCSYREGGERKLVPTPYTWSPTTRAKAEAFAASLQRRASQRATIGTPRAPRTVAEYAEQWLKGRERRGIASVRDNRGRLHNHVLPELGDKLLVDVRPRDVRDLVRHLAAKVDRGDIAPRTALHAYSTLRTMFADAVTEELVAVTPVQVARGELPTKVDKDPEWREQAVYTLGEVRLLLSDPRIPPRRRVENGLKALGGLRHGEAAGLLWRHVELELEPLGRISVVRSYGKKRTKTEVTRAVPAHPELARMLRLWAALWPVRHGRAPGPDDLVVPSDKGAMVTATVAGEMFRRDLQKLGLRLPAGEERNRGGHDLRAWTISTALEHGASPEALQRITHTKRRDVQSGYTRLPWRTLCAAIEAIPLTLPPDPLAASATGAATGDESAREYTENRATLTGFEPVKNVAKAREGTASTGNRSTRETSCDASLTALVAVAATARRRRGST